MNQKDYIKGLLLKFSQDRCSEDEINKLVHYFQKKPNEQVLPEVQELLQYMDFDNGTHQKPAKDLFAEIKKKIKDDKIQALGSRQKKRKIWYTGIAAVFAAIVGGSLYFALIKSQVPHNDLCIVAKDAIILEREDGTIETILENGQLQLKGKNGQLIGGQKGNQLVYKKSEHTSNEIVYNSLSVPYGKRFEIKLSDGSLVFMNAGSSLKYPVNFPKNGKRQVFLTGEAFFKVAKDKGRKFIVKAQNLEIGVLGTAFNVSAYSEDSSTNVVLVEGSVELGTEEKQKETTTLKPGQLGSSNRANKALKISEVETDIYTAWMQGELVFRNMSFENILKKMERHYNVKIINKNTKLAKEKFNASFGEEPLTNILEYFKKIYGLDYIKKNDNTIIINQKNQEMK